MIKLKILLDFLLAWVYNLIKIRNKEKRYLL